MTKIPSTSGCAYRTSASGSCDEGSWVLPWSCSCVRAVGGESAYRERLGDIRCGLAERARLDALEPELR